VVFASPRKLPRAKDLPGRVVVLDIAFAADGIGKGFTKTTGQFIGDLGARLARWVDHHDHEAHERFRSDERFVLCTKAEHGACPEMIDPALVAATGPIDTILCHFDLDGIYAAAKWILGGVEPYPGADDDARAVDTRTGTPSERGDLVDRALRGGWQDEVLRQRVVAWLVGGLRAGVELDTIRAAADAFTARMQASEALVASYVVHEGVARLDLPGGRLQIDKTALLLRGQDLALVAVVVDGPNATIAAPFDSGLDFVRLLELGGGMPTRVNIPRKRLDHAIDRIRDELRRRAPGQSDP
jgi:hypothetical protein